MPLQRVRSRTPCPDVPVRNCRLRRFDALDGCALTIHALIAQSRRSWGSPFEAFPSHLVLTRCRVQDESRIANEPNGTPATLARLPFPNVQPTNKFAVSRIPTGFWALLPLRVRQPSAVFTPRTIRCSRGFRLSKDFPLPAPSPSSRTFRSRTCAAGLATVCSAVPQRFSLRGGQLSLASALNFSRAVRLGCCPF